jgi:hypothetical protein
MTNPRVIESFPLGEKKEKEKKEKSLGRVIVG